MNKQEQLILLEQSILKNEVLIGSLVAKWHGKPSNIGKDIYTIANTIVELNLEINLVKKQSLDI